VRESLEKALSKRSKAGPVSCYDLTRDLAGTVRGLPRDLAENPKYMDGFRLVKKGPGLLDTGPLVSFVPSGRTYHS
jgi:hypothetical protein